ncbi:TRM-domain-containing protein [Annulohypoxylon maeteangense]|uniref:TRM-domain-containing protein n=1 Tax=Annulohypoxylon maeteangense TaxID=1927788 RepID=UPI002008799F|nr:TRM-domain-containing protein [Annulohypoxylon maeteangense]KAI0882754.1 TRM-domain-containing protein [Annulohypoxylon maeteangense]
MTSKTKNSTSAATTEISIITRDGQDFTEVKEGLARILVPFSTKDASGKNLDNVEEQQKVFYNPIQQFNRDLTVLAIKAYGQERLAKRHPANAEKVAKRKREKSDIGGNKLKKQEKTEDIAETVQGDTSMVDATESNETKCSEIKRPGPTFTILDALSATGLRALRYAQELPFVTSVTANDLSPTAVEAIKRNAEHNGVESKVNATSGDARVHMYSLLTREEPDDGAKDKHRNKKGAHRPNKPSKKYDVIDLDPYGTAAPFLDAAFNAIRDDGGLLCVTCTDSAVWASNGYPEKAFALYGGVPLKGFHSHEVGLRLILHSLASTAARYGLAIEPLLSLSIDYYCRIFVKVRKSPAQVKFLAGKTMVVYNCDQGCGAWETQFLARHRKARNKSGKGVFYKHGFSLAPTADQLCKECNSKTHLAGPMYGGPLHSVDFIQKVLDELPNASDDIYGTKPRIEGMLQTALEEFLPPPKDPLESCREDEFAAIEPYPFFFHPTSLARVLHCICPDEDSFRGALRHLGYHVTRSHCKAGSLKTDAPWSVIWDVMREWVRQHPIKVDKVKENTPAYTLLGLGNKGEAVKDETARDETTKDAKNDDVDKLEIVFNQTLGRDTSRAGLISLFASNKRNMSIHNSNGVTADTGQVQSDGDLGSVKPEEIALISRRPQETDKPDSYDIYSLEEGTGEQGSLFNLSTAQITSVPGVLLDEFLNEEVPEYLRSGPSRHVHVVVSSGSGTGLALNFYNSVLRPLLEGLGIYALDPSADLAERSKPNNYNLVVTQHANSVRDFARGLGDSSQDTVRHTVVLLSGDGGIIDFLNARAPIEGPNAEANLPLVAILPLGTGNAHFHSQHKLANKITPSPTSSSLVQSLRTLFRGKAAPLPSFKAEFPPGSRIITGESSDKELESHSDVISHLYGGIVASYGFHSQLVWESDTPEYRKHGAERFKMVAQQLLKESHAYNAIVEFSRKNGPHLHQLDRDRHAYILVAMVSNLEKTFTISPASKPLDGELRLVHFGAVSGQKTMDIMMQAYNEGKHIGMKWTNDDGKEEEVGYDEAKVVKITTLEEDARWRKVCIDGTIVELPQGGSMTVTTEENHHLEVLVDRSVVLSQGLSQG